MSSRAGSHAGRGFRYQDVVAAHLAVMGFAGRYPYGMVIPEGRDDLELRASEFRVLCQVKSRRDHMGPFSAKSIAGFIKKMWDSTARQPTDRFLLVLESDVAQRSSAETRLEDLSACPSLIAELKGQRSRSADAARTVVLVLPNPRADAVAELSARLGCASQEAEVYFADLLGLVGQLADENGIREPAEYQGVGVSDVQQRFDAQDLLVDIPARRRERRADELLADVGFAEFALVQPRPLVARQPSGTDCRASLTGHIAVSAGLITPRRGPLTRGRHSTP